MLDGMWQFLLVGGFGAVGAALAIGTGAALLRWYRTGEWPGQRQDAQITTGRIVGLWLRVLVGAAIAGYAVVSLSQDGLLFQ